LDVLETRVEQVDSVNIELTVTIDAAEVDKQVAAAYKKAAQARIPGFRPGKAPRKVLENYYGGKDYFLITATEELVKDKTPVALDSEGFVVLDSPDYNDFDPVEEGKPFVYVVKAKIPPRFSLSSYDPVKIELPSAEPTEEEIQQRIDTLRGYYVEYDEVTDRAAMDGDEVDIIMGGSGKDASKDADADTDDESDADTDEDSDDELDEDSDDELDEDSDDESGKDAAMPYTIGSKEMPESFDKGLIGMAIGETKTIEITFDPIPGFADMLKEKDSDKDDTDASDEAAEEKADDSDGADGAEDSDSADNADAKIAAAASKPIEVTVTVKSIRSKRLPELTDAWVKDIIEYESVDELRSRIAETIFTGKEKEIASYREALISQQLAKRLEGEPPAEMVKQTEQSNFQDFFKMLQDNKITFDQYLESRQISADVFRSQMHEQAIHHATVALALDSLARHFGITVSDEELYDEFLNSGVSDPDGLYKEWQQKGRLSEIREDLTRIKAAAHLRDTAEVFKPGTLVEEELPLEKAAKKPAAKKSTAKKKAAKTVSDEAPEKDSDEAPEKDLDKAPEKDSE